jgi:two-component system response regulator MprA
MNRALIVDDDDQVRTAIARALEGEGIGSVYAPSVDRAMELIQTLEPDVILLKASLGPQSAILMQRSLRSGGRKAPAVVFTNGRDDNISDLVARVLLAMGRPRA